MSSSNNINNKLLISVENKLICDRVLQRCDPAVKATIFEDKFEEFDGCKYLLQSLQNGQLLLHFALPHLDSNVRSTILAATTTQLLQTCYNGIAEVVEPESGYDFSLNIDIRFISRISKEEQQHWAKQLASVRLIVLGTPLRQKLLQLARGGIKAGPIEVLCSKAGQYYFVKPQNEGVVVIFPLRFEAQHDAAIAAAFFQEFTEARRSPSLGFAPLVNYVTAKMPQPVELAAVPPHLIGNPTAGYLLFSLASRHVSGPQLEHVTWQLSTFYYLAQYHVNACKLMMHSRMRQGVTRMMQGLEATKARGQLATMTVMSQQPGGQHGPQQPSAAAARRTISGRFFVPVDDTSASDQAAGTAKEPPTPTRCTPGGGVAHTPKARQQLQQHLAAAATSPEHVPRQLFVVK